MGKSGNGSGGSPDNVSPRSSPRGSGRATSRRRSARHGDGDERDGQPIQGWRCRCGGQAKTVVIPGLGVVGRCSWCGADVLPASFIPRLEDIPPHVVDVEDPYR